MPNTQTLREKNYANLKSIDYLTHNKKTEKKFTYC